MPEKNPNSKYHIILKSPWDSGTHQAGVYPNKFSIDFLFHFPDIYLYTYKYIHRISKMNEWDKNPMMPNDRSREKFPFLFENPSLSNSGASCKKCKQEVG